MAAAWSAPPGLFCAENRIENVVVTEAQDGNSAAVVIEAYNPLKYSIREVANPPALQIFLQDDILCDKQPSQVLKRKLVQSVRYVCQQDSRDSGPVSRIEFISISLNKKARFTSTQKDWFLSIALDARSAAGGGYVPEEPVPDISEKAGRDRADAAAYDALDAPVLSLPESPALEDFVKIGLSNHKPLETAHKELKLAKRKNLEARRNFFPALSARASESEGATQSDPSNPATRADFRRREIGIEIGQPIFQSGRIYFSEKQSEMQRNVAELQIGKITADMSFEIIKTVYTMLQAWEGVQKRRDLKIEAEKVLEITRRKKEIGIASESEYLGVLSAANQIEYKLISQEKDWELAKTRVTVLLNVDSVPDRTAIRFDETPVLAKELELDKLLSAALAGRPEIGIAQFTRRYREFARKVTRAEKLFKLDASAFLGQSGAAFGSETLTMRDSYNVGMKAALYFGGSSLAPLMSKEKTAPDLGSTSRTETTAKSVTVGILDSLSGGSNYLQAQIDEEKVDEDLRKAKREVTLEVKEAFFNYQKAKYQIESSRKELEFRKKEAGIALAKDRLHQIEAPQLLGAISGLAEAEIALKEAIGFYRISLSALEKATTLSLLQ